jgi:hypothetical protein
MDSPCVFINEELIKSRRPFDLAQGENIGVSNDASLALQALSG